MEQKQIEQVAADLWKEEKLNWSFGEHGETNPKEFFSRGVVAGFNHAQSQQPMWREIKPNEDYIDVIVQMHNDVTGYYNVSGKKLLAHGYTHYLASEELLRLPIAQSK